MKIASRLRELFNCRILPLYGQFDKVKNATEPICRREIMMKMMPTIRIIAEMENLKDHGEHFEKNKSPKVMTMIKDIMKFGINNSDDEMCPQECEEEIIDIDMSFTILTDENFEKAWNMWSTLPRNRTKFDAVIMEIYFTSFRTEVNFKYMSDKFRQLF